MIGTRTHAHRRLLFNAVRTHIVCAYVRYKFVYPEAKEVHAMQNAREFPHLTKRSRVHLSLLPVTLYCPIYIYFRSRILFLYLHVGR